MTQRQTAKWGVIKKSPHCADPITGYIRANTKDAETMDSSLEAIKRALSNAN